MDHTVTSGHLCIKGRFGYEYVQELGHLATTPIDVVLASVRKGTTE
jgi:predicted molibdopterin-dependent oxidoreductase YjgC